MTKLVIICVLLLACKNQRVEEIKMQEAPSHTIVNSQADNINLRINTPEGFGRVNIDTNSFADYLRNSQLKPSGTKVILYNGSPKSNQSIHVAVLDIDVGNRDLQQCADAVMRLRGEYLYNRSRNNEIAFNFVSDGKPRYFLDHSDGKTDYKSFRSYMNYVFAYSNTRALHGQLKKVSNYGNMRIGDVFIQTGNPYGHAVIVMDMAQNSSGQKVFLLAQSYMPAQSIHILKNLNDRSISPWYLLDEQDESITTPEWVFYKEDLRRF